MLFIHGSCSPACVQAPERVGLHVPISCRNYCFFHIIGLFCSSTILSLCSGVFISLSVPPITILVPLWPLWCSSLVPFDGGCSTVLSLLVWDCVLCSLPGVVSKTCSACSSWLSALWDGGVLAPLSWAASDPYLSVEHEMDFWGAVGGLQWGELKSWICAVTSLSQADLERFPQHTMLCRCCKFLLLNHFVPASCLSGTLLKTVFIFHTHNYSATIKGENSYL